MMKKITRDELMSMFSSGEKFKLVDVLDKAHYEREHIRGAISLPVNDIERRAGKLLRKDEAIVVYCASFDCQASTNAANELISMGYKHILDYKGGLKDYKEAALPMEGSLYRESESAASTCKTC